MRIFNFNENIKPDITLSLKEFAQKYKESYLKVHLEADIGKIGNILKEFSEKSFIKFSFEVNTSL